MRNLLLITLLAACGQPIGWLEISPEPYQAAQVEQAIAEITSQLGDDFLAHDGVHVSFTQDRILCGDHYTDGCTRHNEGAYSIEVQALYHDVGCTALAHEFMHLAFPDQNDHRDTDLWWTGDYAASVEGRLWLAMCQDPNAKIHQ